MCYVRVFKKTNYEALSLNNNSVMEEIKKEQNFINSTKRTMAARARLGRTKGDEELQHLLDQAIKKLSLLESKFKR